MKARDISEALNYLDDDLILLAEKPAVKKKNKARVTAIVMGCVAAAAVLIVLGGAILIPILNRSTDSARSGGMKNAVPREKSGEAEYYEDSIMPEAETSVADVQGATDSKDQYVDSVEGIESYAEEIEEDDESKTMTIVPGSKIDTSKLKINDEYKNYFLGGKDKTYSNTFAGEVRKVSVLATIAYEGKEITVLDIELPDTADVGEVLVRDVKSGYDLYSSKDHEDWYYACRDDVYYLTSSDISGEFFPVLPG